MSNNAIHCFNSGDSFDTSIRAYKLAEKLGILLIPQEGGMYRTQIKVNDNCEKIAFYNPSNAYAYLLGVEAALKGSK